MNWKFWRFIYLWRFSPHASIMPVIYGTYSLYYFRIPWIFQACALVVKYLNSEVQVIRDSLDGGNLTTLMLEFGRRFYKVLLTHIYQFTYNSQGAMLLLCDINEYRWIFNFPRFVKKLYNLILAAKVQWQTTFYCASHYWFYYIRTSFSN